MATQRMTFWPQVACGLGGAFNALRRHMNTSFSLIFYMNVIGLTSGQAGIIRAAGQITMFVSTLLFGYLCDTVDVPYLSRRLGRRKTWHLLTSVLLALFFMMDYMRCYSCGSSVARLLAYYLTAQVAASFLYAGCDVTHLSIIPAIAQTVDDAVIPNSLRQAFVYITGILTYTVAWAILGQSSGKNLSPSDWKYFTMVAATLVAAGLVCVVIFQIGTHEPRAKKLRKISTTVGTAGLVSVSIVFGLGEPEKEEQQEVSYEDEKTCAAGYEVTDDRTHDQKKTSFRQQHEHKEKINYALQTDGTVEIPSTKAQIETHGVSFSTGVQVFVSQDEQKQTNQNGASQEVNSEDEKTCAAGDEVTDDHTQDQKNTSFYQQHENGGKINYALQTEEPSTDNGKKQESPNGLSKIIDACHVHRGNTKVIKTWRSWLKDPGFYKASFTFVAVRLTGLLTYSYLPLYLTDHLRFDKQAIAYFPLVLFVSGFFGTTITKKLKETFGDKCTFFIAAAGVISGALWFYFLTQETRNMAYAPVVVLGFGLSAQTIMSLTFVTSVIGKDKESSGFVYSVSTGLSQIAVATFLLVAQNLYPTGSEARSNYVRHLLPMSLIALSCSVSVLILLTGTASADQQPPATTGTDDTKDPENSSPQAKDEQV